MYLLVSIPSLHQPNANRSSNLPVFGFVCDLKLKCTTSMIKHSKLHIA